MSELNFVLWNGGECPVPAGHDVTVKFRDGCIIWDNSPELWDWPHNGTDNDIIGYYDHTAAEYATWDDVPEDLKWLAENVDEQSWVGRYFSGEQRGGQPFLSTDESQYKFTRAQWQRARELYLQQEKPAPKWKNGLPPVGEACLISTTGFDDNLVDHECIPNYFGKDLVVFTAGEEEYAARLSEVSFRPILTEAQKAEQERQEAFYQFCRITRADKADPAMQDLFSDLYDAGYRLKDTNNE